MYLARGRPLGNHCTAFKHILHARGNLQMYTSQSFALWRIAHHRLQAHQILLRHAPSPDQIGWISKLNSDVPTFHISTDILQMTVLAAAARELVENGQPPWSEESDALDQTKQLSHRIKTLLASLEDWTSHVGAPWQPSIVDVENLQQPNEIASGSPIPTPDLVLQYADSWLAYMWNCMYCLELSRTAWIIFVVSLRILTLSNSPFSLPNCCPRVASRADGQRFVQPRGEHLRLGLREATSIGAKSLQHHIASLSTSPWIRCGAVCRNGSDATRPNGAEIFRALLAVDRPESDLLSTRTERTRNNCCELDYVKL
jgi:hypothetical protein